MAEELYSQWKDSRRFPESVPTGGPRKNAMEASFALMNKLVDQDGWSKVRDFMVGRQKAGDIKKYVGANSTFGEQ